MKQSAGILMYRIEGGELRVLLVHPGGPLFTKRDAGWWSIPKGEYTDDEDALAAAVRELREETGAVVATTDLVELGSVRQKSGKVVTAWGVEADFDVTTLVSNLFALEWPPRSGVMREFPEVDRGEWFGAEEARVKINSAQAAFVDRLEAWLGRGEREQEG
ncbi:NUDIX hydrolase [Catenulispora acidiphila DSM 44928]|uniref:NUDIX hydrolase n=1 Tax=Catenulispora acidiphila (strain DSM 44928 / JCM 14897 / NBRC 102108 / NRRL B-24433 / ID139908) TaxID=479433 RepID=C7Q894_CATAD|nr:NUDIX domain-containing protein [Catenulispora acidiphila]ACU76082.1 NUDIX hydrolase [Catenulispora acidiphila DSM 44928]